MLELLILYSLDKREQTLYGLKKSITECFGELSIPSHGALHPALKRLDAKNILNIRKKISDGGKRYTYYSVKPTFKNLFNEKFINFDFSNSETLDAFLYELKVRICVSDIVDESLIAEFKEKASLKLNKYLGEIDEKLKNPYLELNDIQNKLLAFYKKEIADYQKLLEELN